MSKELQTNLFLHKFNKSLQLLPLYLRTLKFLKIEQICYRLWYFFEKKAASVLGNRFSAKTTQIRFRHLNPVTFFPHYHHFKKEEIEKNRFKFLNKEIDFGHGIDWQIRHQDRLWRYNLNYFQYLHPEVNLRPESAFCMMSDWIKANPPGTTDSWDPFPLSLRLVNWLKYISTDDLGESDIMPLAQSAHQQAFWLEKRLERHLLANHFFKNLKALIFAGLFFDDADAQRWLEKSLRALGREISEQVLVDGGHFERSPMYHSMILEDCLDLLNIFKGTGLKRLSNSALTCEILDIESKLDSAVTKMIRFLFGMTHPDGQIALFNDAAFGIEMPPVQLAEYYEKVTGKKVEKPMSAAWSFPASGYFVIAPRAGSRLLIDCGPMGPDYQPGHGHCDMLSFELSIEGKRVIVDSGCSQYTESDIRNYNRGNSGHNTLTIDGQNQSEVWASHRCGRRARPLYARLSGDRYRGFLFEGAHNGYYRLEGLPIHHRRIKWAGNEIMIEDRVSGNGAHDIESRLHINPDLDLSLDTEGALISAKGEKLVQIKVLGFGALSNERGWYCPEFGIEKDCRVLTIKLKNADLPVVCNWLITVESSP